MRPEFTLAFLLVVLASIEAKKNSPKLNKYAVHKHYKRHTKHKIHDSDKDNKRTKPVQKRDQKIDNKQSKRMVSDAGSTVKPIKRSWICHPGCRKFCLPSCKASCCQQGAAEYHPGMLRSIEEYQRGIEQNLRAQILEGVAPTSTDCGPLCNPSCAPLCNSACCSANSAPMPAQGQTPAPYMYCGTDCSPNCGPICAEDCCAANSNPYDSNNMASPGMQAGQFTGNTGLPGSNVPYDQSSFSGPMGYPQINMNNPAGMNGFNPGLLQQGPGMLPNSQGQFGGGGPYGQNQLSQSNNGGLNAMQDGPSNEVADQMAPPLPTSAKALPRPVIKKKKKTRKAKSRDGLACDESCERLCLPSCKFLCCIPARFRNPAVAEAANRVSYTSPAQQQQQDQFMQQQQQQQQGFQQQNTIGQGSGCVGKPEVCNPAISSPSYSSNGSPTCGADCSSLCAPACSQDCCGALANQQINVAPSFPQFPVGIGGCSNGCSNNCAPQCSSSCCNADSGMQVIAAGLQAIPLPQMQDQLNQQQTSCPGGCSSTCAPLCNARCCSANAGVSQTVSLPGTPFVPPPPPPRRDCGSACTSTCAPQCSATCCNSGGAVDTGRPMPSASLMPQNIVLTQQRGSQDCADGCPSFCAPDCSSTCCQGMPQLPPSMPAILQQIQRQIPVGGPPPSTCPMNCPQQCAPQCTPQCCFPSANLPPMPSFPPQLPPPMPMPMPMPSAPQYQPSGCSAFPGCANSCAPQCAPECCQGTAGINTGVPPPQLIVTGKFVQLPPPPQPLPFPMPPPISPPMPPPMPIPAQPAPMPMPVQPFPTLSGCPQQCPSECAPTCSDSCCNPQDDSDFDTPQPERMLQLPPGPPPPALTCPSSCSDSCAPECSSSCCDSTPDLSAMAKSISSHCSGGGCSTEGQHWDKRKKIQPVADDKRDKIPRAKLAMLKRNSH